MLRKHSIVLIALLVLAAIVVACGPGQPSSGQSQQPAEAAPLSPSDADPGQSIDPDLSSDRVGDEAPADNVDPAEICPEPTEGTALYRSDENGYCFLYPAEFEENPNWDQNLEGAVTLVSPALDPESIEPLITFAQVLYTGPAGDLPTAEAYADAWIEAYSPYSDAYIAPGDEYGLNRSDVTIGGHPAVQINNVPGRALSQMALLVVDGYRYRIVVNPQPGEFEELDAAYGPVWDTITESIVFHAPSVQHTPVSADDVCPAESEGTLLVVNRSEGYCFLVPADFDQEAGYGPESTWLAIGAPVETGSEMGSMQSRLVFARYTAQQGLSAEQLLATFAADVDAERTEFSAAGGQGVELIDARAPAPSRVMLLVVGDHAYTLVANPYDGERWAETSCALGQGWDSILSTLAFFDKLR